MKNKTIWIVVIVAVVVIIGFIIWSQSKTKRLQQQAQTQSFPGTYRPYQPSGTGGTISSVGGLVDSLANLFETTGWFGGGGGDQGTGSTTTDQDRHLENCVEMYPNDPVAQQQCASCYPQYC